MQKQSLSDAADKVTGESKMAFFTFLLKPFLFLGEKLRTVGILWVKC